MRNVEKLIRGMISRAPLKELMTAVPIPVEKHAEIMRKRIEARRQAEEAQDRRYYQNQDNW